MRRVELTLPIAVLDDLGILDARFFRHNDAVEVLQSFSIRQGTAALIVRVRRRGPFKDPARARREARAIGRRYRLDRFEILTADRERGEYLAWIEWDVPPAFGEASGPGWGGLLPLEIARAGPDRARVVILALEDVLPRLRRLLEDVHVPYRVLAVRRAGGAAWSAAATLTARQRSVVELAFRMGYYESPARVNLDRLSALVGISKAAVSKHLRAAERKVLGASLAIPGWSAGREEAGETRPHSKNS